MLFHFINHFNIQWLVFSSICIKGDEEAIVDYSNFIREKKFRGYVLGPEV